MVGDTIYRPQGLAAYRGGTVSGPIRSLVHVPLDGTERKQKRKGGGWDVRAWFQAGGGVCNQP